MFEKIIEIISPATAVSREKNRKVLKNIRSYEAGSKSARLKKWCVSNGSANTDIDGALETVKNRARHLYKNDTNIHRGVNVIVDNVVGRGVMLKLPDGDLNELWKKWIIGQCDFYEKMSFVDMQKLVIKTFVVDGELLVRRRIVSDGTFPLRLQLIEADHLVSDQSVKISRNNSFFKGVETDNEGRVLRYHLYKEHPNNTNSGFFSRNNLKQIVIPKKDMLHIYKIERIGQSRGMSELSSAIIKAHDLDEYQDAELLKQKISSLFAGFIKDMDGDDDDEELELNLEAGSMNKLPAGMSIDFSQPPSSEHYPAYVKTILRSVATGLGVSYEAMTGDYSEVNFSSGRMGWIETGRNFDSIRDTILNTQFNKKVAQWFLNTAIVFSGSKIPQDINTNIWIDPKREMLDPTKEVPAKIMAIRGGLSTLSEAVMQQGKHPDDHFAQLASDKEMLDKLGIIIDSDASQKSKNGDFIEKGILKDAKKNKN